MAAMAPHQHRRPGASRKAQYGLFVGYVIAVLGAGVGLLLAVLSFADPAGLSALRRAAAEITAPVARVTESAVGSITGVDDAIGAYVDAGAQNRRLRRQVDEARRRLVNTSALEEENRQLRALLKLSQDDDSVIATSRLLSSSATSTRRIALLDAGRNAALAVGQPVRAADGLIGRLLDVGPTTARVLLLTDGNSIVPVRRASDGVPAIATGLMNGDVDVRASQLGMNPFRAGDILVTSGTGGLYHPNIPVAIVVRRSKDGAIARPLADPAKVDAVVVLRAYAPSTPVDEPIDPAAAPPPATPTPTAAP